MQHAYSDLSQLFDDTWFMCPLHDEIHSQIILTWNILLPVFWNFVAQRHVNVVIHNLVYLYSLIGGGCHDVMGCVT